MKNTIKPLNAFRVRNCHNKITGEKYGKVFDGEKLLMIAKIVTVEEYKDEKQYNECFNLCEVFTTEKGNQFVYFRDEEIDVDYIVKIASFATVEKSPEDFSIECYDTDDDLHKIDAVYCQAANDYHLYVDTVYSGSYKERKNALNAAREIALRNYWRF